MDQRHEGDPGDVTLSARDRAIVDFEREWWRYGQAREAAALARFGLDAGAYHRRLAQLIDRDDILAHDPLLVRRLRRQRSTRRHERSARREQRSG